MRTGDFSALSSPIYDPATYDPTTKTRQVFPGNLIPANRIDPIAKQLIAFYPGPQNGNLSQNFIFNPPNQEDVGRINTREDYQVSQKHQIYLDIQSARRMTYRRPPACRRPHSAAIRE